MSYGHYGIDPRFHSPRISSLISEERNYNPCLNIPNSAFDPRLTNPSSLLFKPKTNSQQRPSTALASPQSHRASKLSNNQNNIVPYSIKERNQHFFDEMMLNLLKEPLYYAIEKAVYSILNCTNCFVWINRSYEEVFISPTRCQKCSYNKGLIGRCFSEQRIMSYSLASRNGYFDPETDVSTGYSLYFPINDFKNETVAIAQCIRRPDRPPFGSDDDDSANFFMKKFSAFSPFILPPDPIIEVSSSMKDQLSIETLSFQIVNQLQTKYCCESISFWMFDGQEYQKLDPNSSAGQIGIDKGTCKLQWENVTLDKIGAILQPISKCYLLNSNDITKCPGYLPQIDGNDPIPILVVPYRTSSYTFSIVLKGLTSAENGNSFSSACEMHISKLIPTISHLFSDIKMNITYAQILQPLLNSLNRLSHPFDLSTLLSIASEQLKEIMKVERGQIFIIDQNFDSVSTEEPQSKSSPSGIAKFVMKNPQVINILDAYKDSRFDQSEDFCLKQDENKTKTILAVPIKGNRDNVIGIAQVTNAIDKHPFNETDEMIIQVFVDYFAVMFENTRMYSTQLILNNAIQQFSTSNQYDENFNNSQAKTILSSVISCIDAKRGTVYIPDGNNVKIFMNVGEKASNVKILKVIPEPIDEALKSQQKIVKQISDSDLSLNEFPLFSHTGSIIGVFEILCKGEITSEDERIIYSACNLLSHLFNLNENKISETPITSLIIEEEKNKNIIPAALQFTYQNPSNISASENMETSKSYETDAESDYGSMSEELSSSPPKKPSVRFQSTSNNQPQSQSKDGNINDYSVMNSDFNAYILNDIEKLRVIFFIFNDLNLFKDFKVPSQKLLNFVSSLKQEYHCVQGHDWSHAVSTLQFFFYLIKKAQTIELTKFETLAVFIASLGVEAGSNYSDLQEEVGGKSMTNPLNILLSQQSILQTRSLETIMKILSLDDNNILSNVSVDDKKKIWSLIVELIYISDMIKHNEFMNNAKTLIESNKFDPTKAPSKLTLIKLLFKVSTIGAIGREKGAGNNEKITMSDSFFRSGDVQGSPGMVFKSPDCKTRDGIIREKSMKGFYQNICLPQFALLSKYVAQLQFIEEQARKNFKNWK